MKMKRKNKIKSTVNNLDMYLLAVEFLGYYKVLQDLLVCSDCNRV